MASDELQVFPETSRMRNLGVGVNLPEYSRAHLRPVSGHDGVHLL